MPWLQLFRSDLARFQAYQPGASWLALLGMHQGLWALLQYRVARSLYLGRLPAVLKRPLMLLMLLWRRIVEATTGISIHHRADIGTGFYIGHYGAIRLGAGVKIGNNCNISQGVTIGAPGGGAGCPVLKDRVYVAANAMIAGAVTIGQGAVVGANALVTRDVPPKAVVLGAPSRVMSFAGSADYLDPDDGPGTRQPARAARVQ